MPEYINDTRVYATPEKLEIALRRYAELGRDKRERVYGYAKEAVELLIDMRENPEHVLGPSEFADAADEVHYRIIEMRAANPELWVPASPGANPGEWERVDLNEVSYLTPRPYTLTPQDKKENFMYNMQLLFDGNRKADLARQIRDVERYRRFTETLKKMKRARNRRRRCPSRKNGRQSFGVVWDLVESRRELNHV